MGAVIVRFLSWRDVAAHKRKSRRPLKSAAIPTTPSDRRHAQKHGMLHVTHGEKIMKCLDQPHLVDCSTLAPTELRRRYPAEANSHRNMLQRAKTRGNSIHPEFRVFGDFLTHLGPRPSLGATIDRIDNTDPEYAPGKVRWADKRTQNSNKGDTLLFYYSRTGHSYTVSRLAKLRKAAPSTIRKQKERGWSDDEIIEGKRHNDGLNDLPSPAVMRARKPHQWRPQHPAPPPEDSQWLRDARDAAWHRQEYGEEYCLAEFEILKEDGVSREGYDWKFGKWWHRHKPHIIRNRLPEWAQVLIAKIEGTTVAEMNRP